MSETALAGVKVLEYCEMVSGPYCAKLMPTSAPKLSRLRNPGLAMKHGEEGLS